MDERGAVMSEEEAVAMDTEDELRAAFRRAVRGESIGGLPIISVLNMRACRSEADMQKQFDLLPGFRDGDAPAVRDVYKLTQLALGFVLGKGLKELPRVHVMGTCVAIDMVHRLRQVKKWCGLPENVRSIQDLHDAIMGIDTGAVREEFIKMGLII